MTMPRASIVIPCLNAAHWVRGCVESALAQDGAEVIVVDNGSTDESLEILRDFGSRIRLLEAPQRGAPRARNTGLAAARSDWVQFLDADDALLPGKIAHQLEHSAQADVVFSPTLIENTMMGTREVSPLDPTLDLPVLWCSWQLPQTGGALWRKAALTALGGWREDQPCCQEHELYLRALRQGLRFVHAPTVGAIYRIWSEETLCRRNPRQVVRTRTQLIDDWRAWLESTGRWNSAYTMLAGQVCFELARTLAQHDLLEAAAYRRERQARGLFHVAGPAAPARYRLAHRLLGFSTAERLAALLR
jgi:glycosyltransferase involved in cell wall biosynthesis